MVYKEREQRNPLYNKAPMNQFMIGKDKKICERIEIEVLNGLLKGYRISHFPLLKIY